MEKSNKHTFEIVLLILYTWLNLRILVPFLFGQKGLLVGLAYSNRSILLALFVGLFLNVALILYWIDKNKTHGK